MREIRLYGSEGGGAARSPYPYQASHDYQWIPAFAGMTKTKLDRSLNLVGSKRNQSTRETFPIVLVHENDHAKPLQLKR